MYKQFAALFKSVGKISQNSPQVIKFIDVIGTICYSGVTFIEILIKDSSLLWYKSIHTIYRSFQDVWGKNHKNCTFPANAKIYLFCKLNLNTMNLKRPVNSNSIQSIVSTHSTIANRQHRVFLTFLTIHLSVVLALLMFVSQYMSLWQQSIAHSGYLWENSARSFTHAHSLLKQYTKASS